MCILSLCLIQRYFEDIAECPMLPHLRALWDRSGTWPRPRLSLIITFLRQRSLSLLGDVDPGSSGLRLWSSGGLRTRYGSGRCGGLGTSCLTGLRRRNRRRGCAGCATRFSRNWGSWGRRLPAELRKTLVADLLSCISATLAEWASGATYLIRVRLRVGHDDQYLLAASRRKI